MSSCTFPARSLITWSQQADGLGIEYPPRMPFQTAVGFKIKIWPNWLL